MKRHDDTIITGANKNGAKIIQDVKLDIKDSQRRLNNTENYGPLPDDPAKINNDTVYKTIKRFEKKKKID